MILAPTPLAEAEPADRIGCCNAGEDCQSCCDMGLAAVFRADKFGDLEKRSSLLPPRAAFGGRTRDKSGVESSQPPKQVEDAFAVHGDIVGSP